MIEACDAAFWLMDIRARAARAVTQFGSLEDQELENNLYEIIRYASLVLEFLDNPNE